MLPAVPAADAPVARATANPPIPTRADILRLQEAMLPIATALPEPQHIFHDGWYERRLLVPAGMRIVGKTQRHAHFFGVISGHALLISEFGCTEVAGGFWKVSMPGIKHLAMAFEDTLFVTLHRNESNTRDLAAIEAAHIEPELLIAAPAPVEVLQ